MNRKIKEPQHALSVVPRREGFRKDFWSETILNSQPDHLLFSATRKEGKQAPLDEKLQLDLQWQSWNSQKYFRSQASSSSSCSPEWQEREAWHGWREKQRWVQLPWAVSHFARFLHIRWFCLKHFGYRHPRMSCTRRWVKTGHFTVRTWRATDAHCSRVLAHVTVARHLPTSHRWLKKEEHSSPRCLRSHRRLFRWKNCPKCAHILSKNACVWARRGIFDILWVRNNLARSVTKWTQYVTDD